MTIYPSAPLSRSTPLKLLAFSPSFDGSVHIVPSNLPFTPYMQCIVAYSTVSQSAKPADRYSGTTVEH